jgi:hypothetical protein
MTLDQLVIDEAQALFWTMSVSLAKMFQYSGIEIERLLALGV